MELLSRKHKPTMNAFWLLVICWSHCVLAQPLELTQHSALMSVYNGLGSSHVDDEVKSFCIHFSGRLQRDNVPTIRCVVGLCWHGVALFWWQSHTDVRSFERCVIGLTNARSSSRLMNRFRLTGSIPSTIGQLTALTTLYVFVLTIQCRISRFWLPTQVIFKQPVDKLDSIDGWTIDGTRYIVRVRVDYSVSDLTLLASHAGHFQTTS
jgi:hypothetical protein